MVGTGHFLAALAVASALCGVLRRNAVAEIVVTVQQDAGQQMTYGMDFERLWSWSSLKEKGRLARLAVRDCKVDYVRVAINGGAELEEGVLNWSAYDRILDCMRTLKAANPDIRFFSAGLRGGVCGSGQGPRPDRLEHGAPGVVRTGRAGRGAPTDAAWRGHGLGEVVRSGRRGGNLGFGEL